jgi:hypothetical protein
LTLQISFPLSWLLYSTPRGWRHVNFIHFLAPFVILGIGLDDIFVCISFFQNTRPFMGHFALDTRLTSALAQAGSTMLATSVFALFQEHSLLFAACTPFMILSSLRWLLKQFTDSWVGLSEVCRGVKI